MDTIEDIVDRLVAARRPGAARVMTDTPVPDGLDGAYRVQSGVAARLGPVGAFKCGRRAPTATPKFAPVFARDVHADGAALPPSMTEQRAVELEIAFRLTGAPPAVGDADFDARLRAVVEMLPALEIVDTRLVDRTAADEAWQLADNQNNGAIVTGTRFPAVKDDGLDVRELRLEIGGREIHAGPAAVPGGDVFATFAAFTRAVGVHCGGLRPGQVCITGALSGPHPVRVGERVHGWIDGLGTVSVHSDG